MITRGGPLHDGGHRMTQPLILCPIYHIQEIVPCPPEEVLPLVEHLRANVGVAEATAFPRGTILSDGRLDLCKQSLGPGGCRLVTEALAENTFVKSLLLGTDGIGNVGAGDVARLIKRNNHLEIVYLGCNRIEDAGVLAL